MRQTTPNLFILALATVVWIPTARAAETKTAAEAELEPLNIPVFRLTGMVREAPPQFDWGLDTEENLTLYDLISRMNKARKDPKVRAVVLTFESPTIGWAQRQEIRQAIKDLEAADKDVYSVLEEEEGSTYLLASPSSRICVVPTGGIDLVGMHVEEMYFKNLLDKIGVQADILHMGDYKGAGEPFTRTGPSDQAKEMLEWLVKDLYEQMIQQIAEDRKLEPAQVKDLIDRGPFTAKEALNAKLVDEVLYAEKFIASLKERYGENIKLVHNYGERKLPEIDLSNPFGFFKLFGEMMNKTKSSAKPQIAIVYVDGMIVTGKTEDDFFGGSGGTVGSTTIRRLLNRLRDDDQVKAVVLRISSPGGSATASDIMWHAATELGDEKPLVVSMGDMAASGGYYLSVGANTIFADPGTLTGSIGVIGGKLVTSGLWNWIGVTTHELSYGKHADLYNTNRPFTDEQREVVRKYMEDVYGEFKDRVTKGRKDKLKDDLDKLAGGRVYTGRQAKANGLVDNLGTLQDAIKFAATEAKVSNYDIVQMPEPKNFFEMFFKGLAGEKDKDTDSVQITTRHMLSASPAVADLLKSVRHLDPVKARAILSALKKLEILSGESTLLAMPEELIVK